MKASNLLATLLRFAMAAVLLAAAGLKGYIALPAFGDPSGALSRTTLADALGIALVIGEVVLAVWTLCGVATRSWWWVALLTFAAFGGYSAWEVQRGLASCGCFGRLQMNPRYTMILDWTVVLGLLVLRRPLAAKQWARRVSLNPAWASVASIVLIAGAASVGAIWERHSQGDHTAWPPEKWPFSHFSSVWTSDLSQKLTRGKWVVVVYREGCPRCLIDMRRYESLAEKRRRASGASNVALLEMPPYYSGPDTIASPGSACLLGKVTSGPVATTPSMTSMIIEDDIIQYVAVP